jgi:stearoyl-CoA desaturase (delta-9 desaturase)
MKALKMHLFHAAMYAIGIATAYLYWDPVFFTIGILMGVLIFGFGYSISLHRLSGHSSFIPKNNFIKVMLLWVGNMCCIGSSIEVASIHAAHHRLSDTNQDPHTPRQGIISVLRILTFAFKLVDVRVADSKHLVKDKMHMFFHNHYWSMILTPGIILAAFNPLYFGYFYALPIAFALFYLAFGLISTHLDLISKIFTYRNFDTDDYTNNNHLLAIASFGESYHNNHHYNKLSYSFSSRKSEFDIGEYIVRAIGIPTREFSKPWPQKIT